MNACENRMNYGFAFIRCRVNAAGWTPGERRMNAGWTPGERRVNAGWTPVKFRVNGKKYRCLNKNVFFVLRFRIKMNIFITFPSQFILPTRICPLTFCHLSTMIWSLYLKNEHSINCIISLIPSDSFKQWKQKKGAKARTLKMFPFSTIIDGFSKLYYH